MPFDSTNYGKSSKEEMYVQNLTFLRDFIANLPKKNFNYANWLTNRKNANIDSELKVRSCNTVGCIGGWLELLAMENLLPFKPRENGAGIILWDHFGISDQAFQALCAGAPFLEKLHLDTLAGKINTARLETIDKDKEQAIAALNAAITYYQERVDAGYTSSP